MIRKTRTYTGTQSQEVSTRELENRAVARDAAAQSMVLLENDGVLPIALDKPIALFGMGALYMFKGGTGSGDVNEREVVSIAQGLRNAGYTLANEKWLSDYEEEYTKAREDWKNRILDRAAKAPAGDFRAVIDAYIQTPRNEPAGRMLTDEELAAVDTDTAIYIISRIAGESADRHAEPGDYYLSDEEKAYLTWLRKNFAKLIVVINCGGQMDVNFLDELPVNALMFISQPGMEGGNAFADVISGKVTPSGKLTNTWAYRYEDFPGAEKFGYLSGDLSSEVYNEGIYMGYRYFDTFGVKPRYPFGYGLSYTSFETECMAFELAVPQVKVTVKVTNTGKEYAGKEVVQIYAKCPQTELAKELQRLCAFGKTPLLAPSESCTMAIEFPMEALTSYDQAAGAYVLDQGDYVICVGNSSANNASVGVLRLAEQCKTKIVDAICPLEEPIEELKAPKLENAAAAGVAVIEIDPASIVTETVKYDDRYIARASKEARELTEKLTEEQLVLLTSGDPGKSQDNSQEVFGSAGLSVPGSAGESNGCALEEPWNLASIVMADGPAGLRLAMDYSVRPNGSIVKKSFMESVERGMLSTKQPSPEDTIYHQYCTAFPVGTLLAQSWDVDLVYQIGKAVARELEEYNVTLWLAPGMNLHRNPLCGRNFEYYSEDPVIAGMMAAAMTKGVQENGSGVGTTIKHFACNNLEDNRKFNNSVVGERALRELYLRGFEIAVRSAQPMAVMTSYNPINGVHAANSFDLNTKVLRNEWGFEGLVMTDWNTTGRGGSSPVECVRCGHNLIMPGTFADMDVIKAALAGEIDETLDWSAVRESVAGLVDIVLQSREYEEAKPYARQFESLPQFVKCEVI